VIKFDSTALYDIWLALMPVLFAHLVVATTLANWPGYNWLRRIVLAALWLSWLVWLPNTCYLITEWRHLLEIVDKNDLAVRAFSKPQLYLKIGKLAFFYFCFSMSGVVALVLGIRPIERLLQANRIPFWICAVPLFSMLSVGVYLGLILRFNSWNLLTHPASIFAAVAGIAGRPALLGTIFFFAALLWALYEAVDLWIDALLERWSSLQRGGKGSRSRGFDRS
jgi:uncharacterized membrane protein